MPVIEERLGRMGLELPAVFAAPPGLTIKFDLVRLAARPAAVGPLRTAA